MLRVPQEPLVAAKTTTNKHAVEQDRGVRIPKALDFAQPELTTATTPDAVEQRQDIIDKHKDACLNLALQLSDLQTEPNQRYIQRIQSTTANVPNDNGTLIQIPIQVDTIQVAGASHEGLLGVRHVARVPMSPEAFIDGYIRVNYTNLVDPFTNRVDLVEDLTQKDDVNWSHVVYTVDWLAPFFSEREFVTLDFTSMEHNLLVSRSCQHPAIPTTRPPGWCNHDYQQRYRSPLFFFLRTIHVADLPNQCLVVQFQFSDMGGIVPIARQVKAVIQFGNVNIPKVTSCLLHAAKEGVLLLGQHTNGGETRHKVSNPLQPTRRQDPLVMLGLVVTTSVKPFSKNRSSLVSPTTNHLTQ